MTRSNRQPSVILFMDLHKSISAAQPNETEHQTAIKYWMRITGEIAASLDGQLVTHQASYLLMAVDTVKQALQAAKTIAAEWEDYSTTSGFDDNLIPPRQSIHVGEVRVDEQGNVIGADANIAQRISMAAVPGGIALSEAAYSAVQTILHDAEKVITEMVLPSVAANYIICLLPSIEPSLYPLKHATVTPAVDEDFVITKIINPSPEKFSFTDTLLVALGVAVFLDFAIANIYMRLQDADLNTAILYLSNVWMLLFNMVVIAGIITGLLRSAMKVMVKTVPGADAVAAMVLSQMAGIKPKKETVITKQSVKWLRVMAGKNEIRLSGNGVVLTGHWSSIRRIRKLLKRRDI
jgi:hypothetical protein